MITTSYSFSGRRQECDAVDCAIYETQEAGVITAKDGIRQFV